MHRPIISFTTPLTWESAENPRPFASIISLPSYCALSGTVLLSIAFLGHQIGSFLGAWYGGFMFDRTGSYTTVWIFCIVLSVVAAALWVPIDEREVMTLRAGRSGA